MIKLAEERNEISVVSNQVGVLTNSNDLAEFIVSLVLTDKYGTYHGVKEGYCSWDNFSKEIFEKSGLSININPILSEEYPTRPKRPLKSRLGNTNSDVAIIKRLSD